MCIWTRRCGASLGAANSAGPTLKDYIANERRILATVTTPILKRAGGLLEHCIAQGSLHIRSHIDVAPDIGVKHVEAMLELRAAYGDVVDMQFVAFPQTGLLTAPGTAELMEELLKLGVETVGGHRSPGNRRRCPRPVAGRVRSRGEIRPRRRHPSP